MVLVPVFGLVSATMDYGWYITQRHCAQAAAAAGARAGSFTAQDATPIDVASQAAQEEWAGFGLPAPVTIVATQTGTPEQMLVVVSLDNAALVGLVPQADAIVVRAIRQMEEQP